MTNQNEVNEGKRCLYCGCTDKNPCEGGCRWDAPLVCSNCSEKDLYWNLGYSAGKANLILELQDFFAKTWINF